MILGGIVVDVKVQELVELGFVKLAGVGAAFSNWVRSRVWEVRH